MRRSAIALFAAIVGCAAAHAAESAPRNPNAGIAGLELGTRLSSASVNARPHSSDEKVDSTGETATPVTKERKVRIVYPVTQ